MPRRRKTPKEGAESSAEAESSKQAEQAASTLRAEAPVFVAQPRPSAPAQTPQTGYAQTGYARPPAQPRAYPATATVPAQTQIRAPPIPQQATTSVAAIEKGIAQLQVVASFKPPEHALKFPPRPGYGKAGTPCNIKANHFLARLRSDRDIYQYDVTITPEIISRGMNRAIMNQLILLYKDRNLGGKLPAYDGRKSLYTSGPLPFENKEFEIDVQDEDKVKGKTARRFKVVIKMAGSTNMYQLTEYLQGRLADTPQDALQALDIALRELPTYRYSPVGRSFFSPDLDGRTALGQGLECWSGFFQSLRPTQMGLSLNVDMSATAFLRPLPLINFLEDLGYRDLKRRLPDRDYQKIKKVLKGVRIEVTHRGKARRKYRIVGLTSEATKDLKFLEKDTTEKYVTDYFRETYNHEISYPLLPCLCVGKDGKNFLPMEVCKIVEGQRYMKRLQQTQVDGIRRVTCKRPKEREQFILQTVRTNAYTRDKFACEFGIEVQENMALVNARVLDPPKLKFHDSGSIKEHVPVCGRWDMRNKKMVNGGRVLRWACLNFAADPGLAADFCRGLINMCITSGMTFERNPLTEVFNGNPSDPINSLKALCRKVNSVARGQQLDILLVLLPDNNGSLYGDLKRTCETEIGIISQCCLLKNIRKGSPQYFANVALKINVKVGGRNTVLMDAALSRLPMVTDKPTILFGADVTHPHPGEDSSPSIAAVVGSQDWPEISKYACLVQSQGHRKEIIENLADMVRELLLLFNAATRMQPRRIIFYRDGVSEGQFQQVLWHEKEAIKKACRDLHEDYKPTLTFVVVQKRHHTRLFASNHHDRNLTDRSGNILPGTVVDTKICHPTEFDFYLCSHAGIQGTSRPAHYHVLYDENQFTADGLQTLTNNLCYTYARSTNSVSIVPPAYYAHLAAFRARFYMGEEDSDASTQTGGSDAPIRQLPKLKENLKTVMFYC